MNEKKEKQLQERVQQLVAEKIVNQLIKKLKIWGDKSKEAREKAASLAQKNHPGDLLAAMREVGTAETYHNCMVDVRDMAEAAKKEVEAQITAELEAKHYEEVVAFGAVNKEEKLN